MSGKKPVIISLTVAQPVALHIKGKPGDNAQSLFKGICLYALFGSRLQHAEGAFFQVVHAFDEVKFHVPCAVNAAWNSHTLFVSKSLFYDRHSIHFNGSGNVGEYNVRVPVRSR